jgi:hypothetical protein
MTQSNKPMTPFCNKGWKYFDQFQEIMPGSTARGSHAFSPGACAPPGQGLGDEDDEEGSGGASINGTTGLNEGPMDVDKEVDGSTSISASGSKRKLATITSEGGTVASSFEAQPPSSVTSILSEESSVLLDEPSRKKVAGAASSVVSSSKSRSKAPSSRRSKALSSIHSSGRAGAVQKISSELVVHEVQGSINSLTATVRDSMSIDPVTKVRQDALRMLQTRDDGLTEDQEVMMYHKIAANHALAQVYLALDKPVLRRKWLQEVLEN